MPLTPLFTISQSAALPAVLNITDTSTGSDAAITKRKVILQTAFGTSLVPYGTTTDYIIWALAATSISYNVLDKDYVLSISVQWLDVSDNVLYSKVNVYSFTAYAALQLDLYSQLQTASNIPANFYNTFFKLNLEVDNANNAVLYASDITKGQAALNRSALLIQKNIN